VGTVTIKSVTIGEGAPKLVIPLVGGTEEQIIEEAKLVKLFNPDVVEWRADFYEEVEKLESVIGLAKQLREIFIEEILLFTFRSHKEGGNKEISDAYYLELNEEVIQNSSFDLVDIELFNETSVLKALVSSAKENGVYVIMSNHDFIQTPAKEEIVARLEKMQENGADILKIAVMPNSIADVLTLLEATNTMKMHERNCPVVTMAMGKMGMISRLAGEVFGSSLTFGSAQGASAPGQIPADELRTVLDIVHKNMRN